MKGKLWLIVSALVLLTILASACAPKPAATPEEAEAPSVAGKVIPVDQWPDITDLAGMEIIIAEDNAWPPFAYIDSETGEATGFDYEFFEELCKRANCKPVFKYFPWDGIFEAAVAGEWDITFWGITMTLERSKMIDYSDPILEYGMIILVRKDGPHFKDPDELMNSDAQLGATMGGTEALASVKIVGQDRVTMFEADDMPIVALIAGDVDAVVYDETAAMGVLMEHGDKLEISGRVNTGMFSALPMPPGSPIQVAVNAAINEMWADGTMDRLMKKWFPALGHE